MSSEVEYMIRVKLPSPAAYASCPSGDTEYDDDYKKAIFDAKPPGFEVKWPRLNEKWAKDSEGRTIVPLFISNEKDALHHYIEENKLLTEKLAKIKKAIKNA